jgi:hypothetical protein
MPNEQSKAAQRRLLDPRFAQRWFVGDGIDIGCGDDPLSGDLWPNITDLIMYDRIFDPTCNAQTLVGVDDESLDFVHSSHCLEHMEDPMAAIEAWLQVLRPGGFLIVTVPDFVMYEGMHWPSRHNGDHKWAFTTASGNLFASMQKYQQGVKAPLVHLPGDLFIQYGEYGDCEYTIEHLTLLTQHFNIANFGHDQTQGPAECAIEFVLQKQLPDGQVFRTMQVDYETKP